jgi:hypothetical protein
MIALMVAFPSRPAFAYLKLGINVNGTSVGLRWPAEPVRYYVTDAGIPDVDAVQFQQAVGRAFATWQDVPSATIEYEFAGFTEALPGEDDGWSTLGFRHEPDMDRVLASTSFLVDIVTGRLIESDIFFNSAFRWSTSDAGQPGFFDLETIALHEIGHLSGLGHSALGETIETANGRSVLTTAAVMFPIAFPSGTTTNRTLHDDDVAGISDLYPAPGFTSRTGSVSGRVTREGAGQFGAHVVAFNPSTGALVGNFALTADGSFSIAGLQPGAYVVRVEPLDDADVESFFDLAAPLDLNFRVKYHERLAIVPRGGDSGTLRVQVQRK